MAVPYGPVEGRRHGSHRKGSDISWNKKAGKVVNHFGGKVRQGGIRIRWVPIFFGEKGGKKSPKKKRTKPKRETLFIGFVRGWETE